MILFTSLVACLVLAASLPLLGQKVLARRIVFVDLALAQVAASGYALGLALNGAGMLYAALLTCLAVLAVSLMSHETNMPKEAVMGGVYAAAAAAATVLLANLPKAEGYMMDLLFGSLLGVDLLDAGILALCALPALWLALPHAPDTYAGRLRFYSGLALLIVPAVHAVGVLLVFALLVLPALAVWRNDAEPPAWKVLLPASVASIAGILIADRLDWPPSASVVLALAAVWLAMRLAGGKGSAG